MDHSLVNASEIRLPVSYLFPQLELNPLYVIDLLFFWDGPVLSPTAFIREEHGGGLLDGLAWLFIALLAWSGMVCADFSTTLPPICCVANDDALLPAFGGGKIGGNPTKLF